MNAVFIFSSECCTLHSLVVTNMKSEQVLVPQAYRFSVKITKASFIGALTLFNKNIFNNIFDFLFGIFCVCRHRFIGHKIKNK